MTRRRTVVSVGLLTLCVALLPTLGRAQHLDEATPDPFHQHIKRWLILGPIPAFEGEPDRADAVKLQEALRADLLAEVGGEANVRPEADDTVVVRGQEFTWRVAESDDDVLDLAEPLGDGECVIAYAWAELHAEEAQDVVLGVGTDDEASVWVNGELVHENQARRPATVDDDAVPAALRAGRNTILFKVHNFEGDWGFACRVMDAAALGEHLLGAARLGSMDNARTYAERGADLTVEEYGLSPVQTARVSGYEDIAEYLVSQGADPGLDMPEPSAIVDSILSDIVKEGYPGAAMLVSRDGEIRFENGYGLADVGNRVPVTPQTKFRIGSVTKQFTAAAILRLEEQGQLSVDDTLSQFLPDYPRGDEVTLHHLLTHTSGIHNYTNHPDFLESAAMSIEPEEQIEYFRNDPYDFDPGEQWVYSNSGYYLLGHIVTTVAEQPFRDFLREQFFEPLGMHDTGMHDAETVLENEATGYRYEDGAIKKAPNWSMSRARGAGGIYSTVHDLHLWNKAIFAGDVLRSDTLARAFTPVALNDGTVADALGSTYGYGWMMTRLRGIDVIGHGGGLHGFISHLTRVPSKQLTVTILHNSMAPVPRMNPSALAQDVAQIFLWDELPTREAAATATHIDPALFDEYAGHYNLAGMAIFEITRVADKVFALVGNARQELVPTSATQLAVKGTDVRLTFFKDEAGNVTHCEREESGNVMKALRVEEEKEADVAPAILDAYVGEYEYRKGVILAVTRDGDQLLAQLTGQPRFGIYPRSAVEFYWKVTVASVEFVKDETGVVVKLVHRQGPSIIHAPKVK